MPRKTRNLQDIENLMNRRLRAGKRERVLFAFKHGKISQEVKDLTAKLEDSFRVFMIQATLETGERMDFLTSGNIRMLRHIDDTAHVGEAVLGETRAIRSGLSDLAQQVGTNATFDGNFRLFARENLELLEPISMKPVRLSTRRGDKGALVRAAGSQQAGRVFRYRAVVKAAGELSGTHVVVHTYPNRDDRRFVEAVRSAKQTFHPYVLEVLGYSRPGEPGEPSYIVTEDYRPLVDYLDSLRGISKLRVFIQMLTEIGMALDYLEQIGPQHVFSPKQYIFRQRYSLAWGELVVDLRNGGRIKWTRDPFASEEPDDPHQRTMIPASEVERNHLIEDLRPAVRASADVVARRWFDLIANTIAVGLDVPGRMWLGPWQSVLVPSEYRLGAWIGLAHDSVEWSVFPPPESAAKSVSTFEPVPVILPWRASPEGASYRHDLDYDYFRATTRMSEPFDVPDSDRSEMCVDFELAGGRTRWTRYQFSRVPINTTLLLRQQVTMSDGIDSVVRWAPELAPQYK